MIHCNSTTMVTTRDNNRGAAVGQQQQPQQQQQPPPHQHRVLIYTTCYNVLDGVTLTIRKLEQEILAAGHSVCVVTTASGDPSNLHLDGMHPNRTVVLLDDALPVPFVHDPNNPDLTYQVGFGLSRTVKAKIADFKPTIIHITAPDITALHLIDYARTKDIPIMGTYHSNIPEYMEHYPGVSWLKHVLGAFFRFQYNFLQALYVPTPYIERHLIKAWKMDCVTELNVWGRGVDIDTFNPYHRSYKYRHSLAIDDDCPVICWVGRLVPEKRPDIFANVVRRLHGTGLKYHVLIVGAGSEEEAFKNMPNTTFCGWMNTAQLSVAYASSDIFLFPSAVETFGNVTLEAAASGLPVVVEAGCSGHLVRGGTTVSPGMTRQGENGFACPADDEDAFFRATYELVHNQKLRNNCSRASRLMAESLEKRTVVRAMLDNYTTVTDQFFGEYGGKHANRDAVYRKKAGSFLGGNHARPLALVFAEYLIVIVVNVVWTMTSVFMSMQYMFSSTLTFVTPPMSLQLEDASPVITFNQTLSTSTSTNSENNGSTTSSNTLSSSNSGAVISSLSPVRMFHEQAAMDDVTPNYSTSTTSSIASTGQVGDDSTLDGDDQEVEEPLGISKDRRTTRVHTPTFLSSLCGCGLSSHLRKINLCSMPLSHMAAISFVNVIQALCRLESNVRNLAGSTVSFCSLPPHHRFTGKRKGSLVSFKKNDDASLGSQQHHSGSSSIMVMMDGPTNFHRRAPTAGMVETV